MNRAGTAERLEKGLNRRQFFQKFLEPYGPVETIAVDSQKCVAAKSDCRICMDRCPFDALVFYKGQIQVADKLCERCGLCVAVCPMGAVSFTADDARKDKNRSAGPLAGLQGPARGGVRVVTCKEHKSAVETWLATKQDALKTPCLAVPCLAVPCLAALSPLSMANALSSGFDAMVLVCPEKSCPNRCAVEKWLPMADAVNRLGKGRGLGGLLVAVCESPDKARTKTLAVVDAFADKSPAMEPIKEPAELSGDVRYDLSRCLGRMMENAPAGKMTYKELALPFFDIAVDEKRCTLCGACEKNCPTDALAMKKEETRQLHFAGWRCIGCNTCVNKCPEDAIVVRRRLDLPKIAGRESTVKANDVNAQCRKCGRPIANQALLGKVEQDLRQKGLGRSADAVFLCAECKRKSVLPAFLQS